MVKPCYRCFLYQANVYIIYHRETGISSNIKSKLLLSTDILALYYFVLQGLCFALIFVSRYFLAWSTDWVLVLGVIVEHFAILTKLTHLLLQTYLLKR